MCRAVCFTVALCAHFAQQTAAQESKAALATRVKLKQKITVEFKDIGTADVFKDIKGEMDKPVNFKIDNANGLSNNTKLTYQAKDKTVEQILNELSDKFDFGWIVVSNPSNNKIDGWVVIRRTGKKERGYEAGKAPKKSSSLPQPPRYLAAARPVACASPMTVSRRITGQSAAHHSSSADRSVLASGNRQKAIHLFQSNATPKPPYADRPSNSIHA